MLNSAVKKHEIALNEVALEALKIEHFLSAATMQVVVDYVFVGSAMVVISEIFVVGAAVVVFGKMFAGGVFAEGKACYG